MPVEPNGTTERPDPNEPARSPQAGPEREAPRAAPDGGDATGTHDDPEADGEPNGVDAADLPGVGEAPAESDELPVDLAFDLLKNERRRRVLYHLEEADGPVRLGDLAEEIAALENDTTVQALTSAERKRVYVGLYQVHLPKLDDAGVVEFDRARGVVEEAWRAETLLAFLDRDEQSRPWYRYYGGLSAGSAGLYAGGLAGIVPTTLVLGVVLTLFLGCSGAHSVAHRSRA